MTAVAHREVPTAATQLEEYTPSTPVIALRDVSKRFDGVSAVADINLSITQGEIVAIVGPSGAGKTTVLKMLAGLLKPTSGAIHVLGRAPSEMSPAGRAAYGYVPQAFVLHPSLTVEQNARFVAGLYGIGWLERRGRIRDALQFLDLWNVRRRRASNISGGMKRRLALACALLHRPQILLTDEPTAGLDPRLRINIWSHLRTLCESGTTVVITTQYLAEAENCDRVAIISDGRLVAVGTPRELRERAFGGEIIDVETDGYEWDDIEALGDVPDVRSVRPRGRSSLRIVVSVASAATPDIVATLQDRQVAVQSIRVYEPTFDEVFLRMVGDSPGTVRP